jgi:hypothetical protein
LGGIGAVAGSREVEGVFNLVEVKFDGLVGVVAGLHMFLVGKEVDCTDVGICGIEVAGKVALGPSRLILR